MAFLSVIRRWALREKVSIREVARRTGLSRNTVCRYLRSGAVEPNFNVTKRTGSKLDAFADKLPQRLKVEFYSAAFGENSSAVDTGFR